MNPVIENIMTRRSVRSYDSIEIAKDALQTIIDAGNMAPSGCNAQGWRFAVVTDKAFRKRLSEIAEEELPEYKYVTLSGPTHAEEVVRNVLTINE